MGSDSSSRFFLLTRSIRRHHHVLSTVLLGNRVFHRRKLNVVPKGWQHIGGGHRTKHRLRNLGTQRGVGSGGQISAVVHGVRRLRVHVHRSELRVAGWLGILFDEITTILGVTGRERRLSDHVEGVFILHPATTSDVGRGRRKALEAGNEERRHNRLERKGRG